MTEQRRPHRPSYQDSISLEALGERTDPIERLHAAHDTAAVLVRAGHATSDPALVARIVGAVDEIGLPTLADLWQGRPAQSLPGALYRLYVLREWIDTEPADVALEHAAGQGAGHAAPTPADVRRVADEILRGAFTGDVGAALDRAASFCEVVAMGRTRLGRDPERVTRLRGLATELAACADLWRRGALE